MTKDEDDATRHGRTKWRPLSVFMTRPWLAPATSQSRGKQNTKEKTPSEGPQLPCGVWRNPATGWTRYVSIADTGASKSVHHADAFPDRPVMPSPGSNAGDSFTDASGGDVPMMGQRMLPTYGADGVRRNRCSQVVDVAVPLTSIGAPCDEGQIVVFGNTAGLCGTIKRTKSPITLE